MSQRDKVRHAVEWARRQWLNAFDERIDALTGENKHGELTVTVTILNGAPRFVQIAPTERRDLHEEQPAVDRPRR